MKTLTIYQPWCSLIMIEAKPFEFRRWDYRTRERGLEGQRIVLHAAGRPIRRSEVDNIIKRIKDGHSALRDEIALPFLERLATAYRCQGVVELAAGLGTAIIGTPRRCTDLFRGVADSDRIDQHMWAWPLTDIQPFSAPVPMRGLQGFWAWPIKEAA